MGFLDNLIHREVRKSKSESEQSPEIYPVYVDGVEVGEMEVPPPPPVPGWLIAIAIVGAVGTAIAILERIRRGHV